MDKPGPSNAPSTPSPDLMDIPEIPTVTHENKEKAKKIDKAMLDSMKKKAREQKEKQKRKEDSIIQVMSREEFESIFSGTTACSPPMTGRGKYSPPTPKLPTPESPLFKKIENPRKQKGFEPLEAEPSSGEQPPQTEQTEQEEQAQPSETVPPVVQPATARPKKKSSICSIM